MSREILIEADLRELYVFTIKTKKENWELILFKKERKNSIKTFDLMKYQ